MDPDWKKGAGIGIFSAGLAYFIGLNLGFNQSSFTFFLYLYVLTGLVAGLDLSSLESGFLDRVYIRSKDEELRLKKIFSDKEYTVKGTIEEI